MTEKLLSGATALLVFGWVFREWWRTHTERNKSIDKKFSEYDTKLANAVDRFTHEVVELKITLATLDVHISHLIKLSEQMPKIQKDLDALHSKVREFKQ